MWRLSVGGSEKLEEKRSFSLNPKSSLKCHLVVSGSGKIVFHLSCSGCIACMCDNALSHPTSVGHGFLDPPFRPWLDTSCSHQRKISCDTELSHGEDFGVLCTSRTFRLFLCTSNPTPNIHTSQLLDERVKVPRHCLSVGFNALFKGTVPYMVPYLQWVPWRTHDPHTWRCIRHLFKGILFLCIMICPCVSIRDTWSWVLYYITSRKCSPYTWRCALRHIRGP